MMNSAAQVQDLTPKEYVRIRDLVYAKSGINLGAVQHTGAPADIPRILLQVLRRDETAKAAIART